MEECDPELHRDVPINKLMLKKIALTDGAEFAFRAKVLASEDVKTKIEQVGTEGLSHLWTYDIEEECRRRVRNDYVVVNIEIAEPQALRVVQELRVTFADQLGTLGKTNYGQ